MFVRRQLMAAALIGMLSVTWISDSRAQEAPTKASATAAKKSPETKKPEFPAFDKVIEGFTEVAVPQGVTPFFRLWKREKDGQLLAELPRNYASQKHFVALTVASGTPFAGLQTDDLYVYWRKYDKRLAMISPNVDIRSDGDSESKDSVKRLFTDTVLLDVPIVTMKPRGGPVIDLDDLLVKKASTFYGSMAQTTKPHLAKIIKAKSFPENVEVAFEFPTRGGSLMTFHYSFSLIPDKAKSGYKPRTADERVGYFTTSYSDYGKYSDDDTRVRFINRWHLEKRDPSLKLSPPKQPVVFYLEHTTPVRYRRWVREGVLYWNKAFEKIGVLNAIEVRQQDKQSGAHMDKDPEDVRYNFIRWLNNDISTAIGPSRVHPETGQILDADIVLTDGWIRTFETQFDVVMPKIAMQGFSEETLSWLIRHPNWDPRVRLAPPARRDFITRSISLKAARAVSMPDISELKTKMLGDEPLDGLIGRTSQVNGACFAAEGRGYDVAMMRMIHTLAMADDEDDDKDKDDKDDKEKDKDEKKDEDKEQMLDGMPESFIGPLLADLVAHEVGHTLGLRHNFKASSIFTLKEINSRKLKGNLPFAGSVMDYLPVNFNFETGEIQGDFAMIGIGPYDEWAIEYGYTFDKDLKPILDRVAEPELVYATDEDTSGPDPLARRYDFSKDPLDYAKAQVKMAKNHRGKILDKFVDDGESWAKARRGYQMTLSLQTRSTSMMANWLGGAFVNRDRKGDPNGRTPIETVPVEQQRDALEFVIENTFRDDAFGLNTDLLNRMTVDKWMDRRQFGSSGEPTWPIHDRIMGVQSSTLTQLMNPTTLRRVYDNEFRIPSDEDVLTLPELMNAVTNEIWSELEKSPSDKPSDRKPLISSLRRNLQTEHLERLLDLAGEENSSTAALKPITNLAYMTLNDLAEKIKGFLSKDLDSYSRAHLLDAGDRIERWKESLVVVKNQSSSVPFIIFGDQGQKSPSGDK